MVNLFKNKKKMEEKINVIEETKSEETNYEALKILNTRLEEQLKQLYYKLQEANMYNTFKRLDYLFKVVENDKAFSPEFINNCVTEIENTITIPEDMKETAPKE